MTPHRPSHAPLFQHGPLTLRRLQEHDVDALHAVRSDPAVARFQGWRPMSRDHVASFIQAQAEWTPLTPGQWGQVAVCRTADNTLIGDVGVFVSEDGQHAQFGLSLARHVHGQGLGTQTIQAVTQWLFEQTRITHIQVSTDTRNAPCLRALRRAGFEDGEVVAAEHKGEACLDQYLTRHRTYSDGQAR